MKRNRMHKNNHIPQVIGDSNKSGAFSTSSPRVLMSTPWHHFEPHVLKQLAPPCFTRSSQGDHGCILQSSYMINPIGAQSHGIWWCVNYHEHICSTLRHGRHDELLTDAVVVQVYKQPLQLGQISRRSNELWTYLASSSKLHAALVGDTLRKTLTTTSKRSSLWH